MSPAWPLQAEEAHGDKVTLHQGHTSHRWAVGMTDEMFWREMLFPLDNPSLYSPCVSCMSSWGLQGNLFLSHLQMPGSSPWPWCLQPPHFPCSLQVNGGWAQLCQVAGSVRSSCHFSDQMLVPRHWKHQPEPKTCNESCWSTHHVPSPPPSLWFPCLEGGHSIQKRGAHDGCIRLPTHSALGLTWTPTLSGPEILPQVVPTLSFRHHTVVLSWKAHNCLDAGWRRRRLHKTGFGLSSPAAYHLHLPVFLLTYTQGPW